MNQITLASLIESVNDACVKYHTTSYDAIAKYLIANAEWTGWDISPECLNDYITAIHYNAVRYAS